MTTTLPATKARKQFFKLIKAADQPGTTITITVEGEPKVVMMSVEEFEGWQETLEILSDRKLTKNIKEALTDLKKGKVYSLEEVKKKLKL